MTSQEIERRIVGRTPLGHHVGKSGATLERVRLDDGRSLVLKRLTPRDDLVMAVTRDRVGREFVLWRSGVLDRLPGGVGHAVLDGWVKKDGAVLVLRDLGDAVLTWDDRVDTRRCQWMLERLARLHTAFLDQPLEPGAATPPEELVALFAPRLMVPHGVGGNPLVAASMRGWELFPGLVPGDVADAVLGLLEHPRPLVTALRNRPCTLVHGDLATVNMAVEDDTLVLIDWGLCAHLPGAMDVARFVAGCSSVVEPSREEVLQGYAEAAGPAYDEAAMRLSLLAALVWLGWNKALDAVEHPDPEKREREREDLAWWVREAQTTLAAGLL
jgi:hypothetical protein